MISCMKGSKNSKDSFCILTRSVNPCIMEFKQAIKLTRFFLLLSILIGCKPSSSNSENGTKNIKEKTASVETVMTTNPENEDALRQAALDGDMEGVNILLEKGTSVDALNPDGSSALMFAAFNGHTEIVLRLLDEGAEINRGDYMDRTALLYAATGPFPETVKILLDKGAKPNIVDSNEHFSPIMHAAAEGNLEVVKILLEYGADLSLKDIDNDDAESFARQAGHVEVADYLHSVR